MMKPLTKFVQDAAQTAQESETVSTAYDSLWTGGNVPTQAPSALEQIMLAQDKLYVVLAVVLIIWFGIIFLTMRTDRHISKLERSVEDHIPDHSDDL
mgnify:CR=1 FL=1